jgi:DNA polymerase III subunit gamma/tau
MATQSLYRRYRPRRFAELKGQDHIVRALRTSVAEGREGQAYLFSGPRGTGKTTTARIMAKVLNCENPQDGEPCCECASCLSVEQGTSYDVHELDAASNNGVEAMRDLIEKASLGTPGRHKVYILDEVHMLSKGAEAALLKTLEEPPPHVVFVLATTDPQKMSDTIRSRTQHLQFHLLGPDTLQEHVRWVAADAGLTVSDDAIEQVVAQGAGSPRDTLSVLELVSNSGGAATEVIELDDFVEAMIDHDPGRGLTMVAHAVSRGRDPRTITEELVGFMRNGFLALMAPDLVQVPSQRLDALTDVARRAGAAGLVRAIELLGEALNEMRHAPDPRVLLDVATVQLTSEQVGDDVGALVARIQRLERQVADGVPAPADPSTGRTKLGSRAAPAADPTPAAAPPPAAAPAAPAAPPPPEPANPPAPEATPPPAPPAAEVSAADEQVLSEPATAAPTEAAQITAADWEAVRPTLGGMARALFSPATFVVSAAGSVTLGLPNDAHRAKCEQHRSVVEKALSAQSGTDVSVELVVAGGGAGGGGGGVATGPGSGGGGRATITPASTSDSPASTRSPVGDDPAVSMSAGALAHDTAPRAVAETAPDAAHLSVVPAPEKPAPETPAVASGRAIAEQARSQGPAPDPDEGLQTLAETLPDDDEVDLDELVDAPPEAVKTPVDRLAEAFPGSELVDDTY